MKIDVRSEQSVFIEIDDYTFYIDNSTNEQIIDYWHKNDLTDTVQNTNNNKEGFYKDKTMKIATIKVNLEYYFDDKMSDQDIKVAMQNVELPSRYVEDSYELVKIIKEEL